MATWIIWLVIAGILVVVEMLTLTFYLLWLAVGAAVACLLSLLFPDLLVVQIVSGALVSLLLTIFTKPLTRWMHTGTEYQEPNQQLVGKEGVVLEAILPGKPGIVRIGSETWSASAAEALEAGQFVTVIRRGTTILEVENRGG